MEGGEDWDGKGAGSVYGIWRVVKAYWLKPPVQ